MYFQNSRRMTIKLNLNLFKDLVKADVKITNIAGIMSPFKIDP
jgi:hypothetical protein